MKSLVTGNGGTPDTSEVLLVTIKQLLLCNVLDYAVMNTRKVQICYVDNKQKDEY